MNLAKVYTLKPLKQVTLLMLFYCFNKSLTCKRGNGQLLMARPQLWVACPATSATEPQRFTPASSPPSQWRCEPARRGVLTPRGSYRPCRAACQKSVDCNNGITHSEAHHQGGLTQRRHHHFSCTSSSASTRREHGPAACTFTAAQPSLPPII